MDSTLPLSPILSDRQVPGPVTSPISNSADCNPSLAEPALVCSNSMQQYFSPLQESISIPQGELHPLTTSNNLQLAAWLVSGYHAAIKVFQRELSPFSCPNGARAQTLVTTAPGVHGIAGVVKGKLIQFRPLWPLS